MTISLALKLLGMLPGGSRDASDIREASRLCCRELGFSESLVDDPAALLSALLPVLEQQGFKAPVKKRRGKGSPAAPARGAAKRMVPVAGVIARREGSGPVSAEVRAVGLDGKVKRILSRTTPNQLGAFFVEVAHQPNTLVSVCFKEGSRDLHCTPPAVLGDEHWVEWSETDQALPLPGRFDLREARLRAALGEIGERADMLSMSTDSDFTPALAAKVGLSVDTVRRHVLVARLKLQRRFEGPASILSALLGPITADSDSTLPIEEVHHLETFAAHVNDKRVVTTKVTDDDVERAWNRLVDTARADLRQPVEAAIRSGEISADVLRSLPAVESLLLDRRASKRSAGAQRAHHRDPSTLSVSRNLLRTRAPHLSKATRGFLGSQGESFDLIESFIDGLLYQGSTAKVSEPELREIRHELHALQRVARVARDENVAHSLLESGYDSAQKIAFTDLEQLSAELTARGISAAAARDVHQRAVAHYGATVEAYLRFNPDARGPDLPVLGGVRALDVKAIERIPTYQFLFGSQDYAAVEEWETVTSYGAYLVDLLVWMSRAPRSQTGIHPYDVLTGRRPDLVNILLNEANARTLVPHIDLVCELLEELIVRRRTPGAPIVPRQTSRTAEEIRAYPEHVNRSLYDELSMSSASMALPFDLWLEEVRAYLQLRSLKGEAVPLSRLRIVELFAAGLFPVIPPPGTQQARLDLAAEMLGACKTELDLIITPAADPAKQKTFWGSSKISNLADFLRRAPAPRDPKGKLSYDEFLSVIGGFYVDPTRAIRLRLADGVTVDRGRAEERVFDPPLEVATLDRIHRFLRLCRRVNASIAEVDALLSASGSVLDGETVINLASLLRSSSALRLSAEEAAALFRDFREEDASILRRADGTVPLYRRTFLLRSDAEEVPAAYFKAVAPTTTLASQVGRLSAALNLAPEDVTELMRARGLSAGNVSFTNLSALYRWARLSSATAAAGSPHSLSKFLGLCDVLGDPLASIAGLARFLDDLERVNGASLTTNDLQILTQRRQPELPAIALLDAGIAGLRSEVGEKLMKAGQPSGEAAVTAAIVASGAWAAMVSTWLGVDTRLAEAFRVLAADVAEAVIDASSPGRQAALLKLVRVSVLLRSLRISVAEAPFLASLPAVKASASSPNWETLAKALDELAFVRRVTGRTAAYARFCDSFTATTTIKLAGAHLAAVVGREADRVEAAWRTVSMKEPVPAPPDITFLARVEEVCATCDALGVQPSAVLSWATTWPNAAAAGEIRDAVRATLSRGAWLESSATVQDRLRPLKRDALVSSLAVMAPSATPAPGVSEPRDVDEMSAALLIDVEMGACRDTSRVVQAAAAVQMLVQRCLMGLEAEIIPDATLAGSSSFWKQWEWRKRYRVWEANRMLFLYPENFLSTGNRVDASPLFRSFSKKISETEINEENVGLALEEYLVGLEKISRLSYETVDISRPADPNAPATVGMVARSTGSPATYYYRRFRGGTWTPWEEVALGPGPGSLALAQGDERVAIIWPVTSEHVQPDQEVPPAQASSDRLTMERNGGKSILYVRYGWTVRDDRGVWGPVKTTSRALLLTPRDARSFVVNAHPRTPALDAFNVALFGPDPGSATGNETMTWTSTMGVIRDTTQTYVNPRLSGLKDETMRAPRWREHYAEYRLSAVLDNNTLLDPWKGFHFSGNRMLSGVSDIQVQMPMLNLPPVPLLSVAGPVWVTKSRAHVPHAAGWHPDADLFVIGGGMIERGKAPIPTNWSGLVVSPSRQLTLLPKETRERLNIPAGKYLFVAAYHPFADDLVALLRRGGLKSIYTAAVQERPSRSTLGRDPVNLAQALGLNSQSIVVLTGSGVRAPDASEPPAEAFDFEPLSPYGLYNYETFFFAPMLVAHKLSGSGRFREAQAFFHFIFNPLSTEPPSSNPRARFWVTQPFRALAVAEDVQEILQKAAGAPAGQKTNPWQVIEERPFDVHAIAMNRPTAYQKYVVRAYLENLLAWGDSLYRKGTREDVDEATGVYELAETILGEAPRRLKLVGKRPERAFVKPDDWLGGSNVLVQLESLVIDGGNGGGASPAAVHLPLVTASAVGPLSLYFRVAPNTRLADTWTAVETRLRNIRACRTIDGARTSLALEAAPIDPQALADAAAMGLSVGDAIAMASTAVGPYRFRVMLAKAAEYCAELRALGASLMVALEKRDGEQVAEVRSRFEEPILRARRRIKDEQKRQAEAEVLALEKSRAVLDAREKFYGEREYMNDLETVSFGLSVAAGVLDAAGAVLDMASGGLQLIPDVTVGVSGFGGTPTAVIQYGGSTAANSTAKWAQGLSKLGGMLDRTAGLVGTQAGYVRRKEEWDHQAAVARLEGRQVDQQVVAARLRVAVARAELGGQEAEEASWAQVDTLLREKYTNAELYDWHVRRLVELYRRAFDQASEMCQRTRECLAFELGDSSLPQPPAGSWDRLKSGLLSGEALSSYLRDLEMNFLRRRTHDVTVTQHLSLRHVAPGAFAKLVATGSTSDFVIPGWWWKRLYPGLRKRRVRSLSVSVPSVGGAYSNVNATLRYKGLGSAGVKTIVLSSGNNDFGWDMSTRSEMYVPFEGIDLDKDTSWQLDFPSEAKDIDVTTIADVILHIEYSADEGADGATPPAELKFFVDLARMTPDAWASLTSSAGNHTCLVDATKLLPRFLNGYEVRALDSQTLLDSAGTAKPGLLDCTIVPGGGPDDPALVKVAAVPGVVVPWTDLRHLLLVLNVQPAA